MAMAMAMALPSIVVFFFFLISLLSIQASPIRVACGVRGNGTDEQGRVWVGDASDSSLVYLDLKSGTDVTVQTSPSSSVPDSPPFQAARIFTSPASYTFAVSPGRHFLRLFFFLPSSPLSPDRNNSDAALSVLYDHFSLILNLTLSDLLSHLNLSFLVQEYSFNVTAPIFTVSFLPAGSSPHTFAMVNGIEIEPIPPDLFSVQAEDLVTGRMLQYPIADYAFQTVYRLNVGGREVQEAADGLGRKWYTDLQYMVGAATGVVAEVKDGDILYGDGGTMTNGSSSKSENAIDPLTAPASVYASARTMTNDDLVNLQSRLSWNLTVDPGFFHYIRLHFCEIVFESVNERVFDVYINGFSAESEFDVFAFSGNKFVASFRDYYIFNTSNILLQLHPSNLTAPQHYNAILNGIEVFKRSSPDGNLQGPLPPPSAANSALQISPSSSKTGRSRKVIVAGSIVGALAAVVAVLVLFILLRRKRKWKMNRNGTEGVSTMRSPLWIAMQTHPSDSKTSRSKVSISSRTSRSVASSASANTCRSFAISEILQMTNDFDEAREIGVGGFGKVYKGVLQDGTTVAVKRRNPGSEQGIKEFNTEVNLLSRIRHKHLVSLIGFCDDNSELILVYEYMSNGPLRDHLYGTSKKSTIAALSWKQRLEICVASARGLHYLHTGADQGIIHRDVKTSNILLDDAFVAKFSDFGLSKTGPSIDQTHVSTAVKGSFGYLDPEYYRKQHLTDKSDVYSFGVVLLEVLCARPPIDSNLPREQVNLVEWAMFHHKKGMLDYVIDARLRGRISEGSMKKFVETAEKCLMESGLERPAMGDVLWNLEMALRLHESSPEYEQDTKNQHPTTTTSEAPRADDSDDDGEMVGDNSNDNQSGSYLFAEATPSVLFSHIVNPRGR